MALTVTLGFFAQYTKSGAGFTGAAGSITLTILKLTRATSPTITTVTTSGGITVGSVTEVSSSTAKGVYVVYVSGLDPAADYVGGAHYTGTASDVDQVDVPALQSEFSASINGGALPQVVAGASGGAFIAGSNAATTISGLTTGALSCTTITASGAVAFQSTFAVTTSTSLAALSATTITASGAVAFQSTFAVTTSTSLAALSCTTLTASGAVAFQSTFATTGTTTFNAFTITNNLLVSGTTTHIGTTTFTGAWTATNAGNDVRGITATISGVTFPTNFGAMLITSGGNVGIDWANVANQTATNTLNNTNISTAQAVASVASIGAGGITSTSFAANAITSTVAPNLDAAVSSRMATYVQPTGFLATTFGATVGTSTLTQSQVTGGAYALNTDGSGNVNLTSSYDAAKTAATQSSVNTLQTGLTGIISGATVINANDFSGAHLAVASTAVSNVNYTVGLATGLGTTNTSVAGIVAGTIPVAANQTRTGTAQGGSATTITLDSGAVATNGYYINQIVQILSGTGVGQAAIIGAYVGSTKIATLTSTLSVALDNTSVFRLIALGAVPATIAGDVTLAATQSFNNTGQTTPQPATTGPSISGS